MECIYTQEQKDLYKEWSMMLVLMPLSAGSPRDAMAALERKVSCQATLPCLVLVPGCP